jgi:hypothetical protein
MTSRHRSARSFERKYALAPSELDVRGGGAEVDDVVVDVFVVDDDDDDEGRMPARGSCGGHSGTGTSSAPAT